MVQNARPVADVSNDGWTPTPVCDRVNEEPPNDETFVTAPNVPVSSFVVRLAVLGPPATGPGQPAPALTVRLRGPGVVLVELLQNTTLIASRAYDTTGEFEGYTMTLTAAEAVVILWPQDGSDPDFRVRVTAYAGSSSSGSSGSGSAVSPPAIICDGDAVLAPDTFYLRFRDGTDGLEILNGVVVTMTWNGTAWVGDEAGFTTFEMVWDEDAEEMLISFAGCFNETDVAMGFECCAPLFKLTGSVSDVNGTCTDEEGSVEWDIGTSDTTFVCSIPGCTPENVPLGVCATYPTTMNAVVSSACPALNGVTGTATAVEVDDGIWWSFTFTGLPAGWTENFALYVSKSDGVCVATYEGGLTCPGGGDDSSSATYYLTTSCDPWSVTMMFVMGSACAECAGATFTIVFTGS